MCEKKKYCARKIDPCLINAVMELNNRGFVTVSSCCGHGVYPKTIVIKDGKDSYLEFFSGIKVIPQKKRYLNFYTGIWNKDHRKRFYYIKGITS